jgi:hypothetical protein
MNAVKMTLLVIGLLLVVFIVGCQETQAYRPQESSFQTVKFVPTGTGFYHQELESSTYGK